MEKNKQELANESRRQALAKLATLTAYSTPAIVTLLSPELSYAQASGIPAGNNIACTANGRHVRTVGANTPNGATDGTDRFRNNGRNDRRAARNAADNSLDCGL